MLDFVLGLFAGILCGLLLISPNTLLYFLEELPPMVLVPFVTAYTFYTILLGKKGVYASASGQFAGEEPKKAILIAVLLSPLIFLPVPAIPRAITGIVTLLLAVYVSLTSPLYGFLAGLAGYVILTHGLPIKDPFLPFFAGASIAEKGEAEKKEEFALLPVIVAFLLFHALPGVSPGVCLYTSRILFKGGGYSVLAFLSAIDSLYLFSERGILKSGFALLYSGSSLAILPLFVLSAGVILLLPVLPTLPEKYLKLLLVLQTILLDGLLGIVILLLGFFIGRKAGLGITNYLLIPSVIYNLR